MGRKPIHKKAMTPAQRQRRSRAKVKRKLVALGGRDDKMKRRKQRLAKLGKEYIPAPPGITYWRQKTVITPEGEAKIWAPVTQPAAAVMLGELSNSEVAGLIVLLQHEQERRAHRRPIIGPEELEAFRLMASRPLSLRDSESAGLGTM